MTPERTQRSSNVTRGEYIYRLSITFPVGCQGGATHSSWGSFAKASGRAAKSATATCQGGVASGDWQGTCLYHSAWQRVHGEALLHLLAAAAFCIHSCAVTKILLALICLEVEYSNVLVDLMLSPSKRTPFLILNYYLHSIISHSKHIGLL